MRQLGGIAVVSLAAATAIAAAGTSHAVGAEPAAAVAVVSHEQLTPRLHEYVLASPALGRDATVRVHLPTGYTEEPRRQWPMALLLHGRSEDASTWSDQVDLDQFDGMVIVTPEGGRVGWYTDWFDDSCCDPQRWETFHHDEVVPWAAQTFRLSDRRSQRFVAGVSMGGFGAMSYAARHPDRYAAAAELSGFVDLMLLETSGTVGVDGQNLQVAGVPPGAVFGPALTEEVRWRGHNPVDLAANLAWTDLVLRHGNGVPGRFGGDPDPGEAGIRLTGVSFHERLTELGIDHRWDDYGDGVHTWPYWEWGLQVTWPRWEAIAAAAAPDPSPFSYRSIEPAWTVYGWDVRFDREVVEFAEFTDVTTAGFTLTGSGQATVTSPAAYPPSTAHAVVSTAGGDAVVISDATGRLTFDVDLGPSHAFQQFTPAADVQQAAGGSEYFTTTTVTIAPATPDTTPAPPTPDTTPAPAEQVDDDPATDHVDADNPTLPATGGGHGVMAAVLLALAVLASGRHPTHPRARSPAPRKVP